MPRKKAQGHTIRESKASAMGVRYEVANGQQIANEGERHMVTRTEAGQVRKMISQVCDVNKCLLSIIKTCRAGHTVTFRHDGGAIKILATGEEVAIGVRNNAYVLPLWVRTSPDNDAATGAGFARQAK